jgi:hypothetical protein
MLILLDHLLRLLLLILPSHYLRFLFFVNFLLQLRHEFNLLHPLVLCLSFLLPLCFFKLEVSQHLLLYNLVLVFSFL